MPDLFVLTKYSRCSSVESSTQDVGEVSSHPLTWSHIRSSELRLELVEVNKLPRFTVYMSNQNQTKESLDLAVCCRQFPGNKHFHVIVGRSPSLGFKYLCKSSDGCFTVNRFQIRFAYAWEYERAVRLLLQTDCNINLLDVKAFVTFQTLSVECIYPARRPKNLKVDLTDEPSSVGDFDDSDEAVIITEQTHSLKSNFEPLFTIELVE